GSRMIVGWSTYEYESPRDAKMEYNENITKDIILHAIWDTYETVTLNYVEDSSRNTIYTEQLKVFSQKESPFPTAEDFNEKTGYIARIFPGITTLTLRAARVYLTRRTHPITKCFTAGYSIKKYIGWLFYESPRIYNM
ncbi:MAG: hypothetical protein J6T42_00695, partial [Clostridia bacterium]|nr:hypothetical protein [Clostridia bacterium]